MRAITQICDQPYLQGHPESLRPLSSTRFNFAGGAYDTRCYRSNRPSVMRSLTAPTRFNHRS